MQFKARNGETINLAVTENGQCLCPVCREVLFFLPYDPETHAPSQQWCSGCETQFGWDDIIPHDAPPGALQNRWQELREIWLRDVAAGDQDRR